MSTFKLMALLVLTASLFACESTTTAPKAGVPVNPTTTPVTILRKFSGNDEALKFPAVMIVKSQAELQGINAKSLMDAKVDFAKESLVVVALGDKPTGGYWADITGIQAAGPQLFVQGWANKPGKDAVVTQAVTYPFAAAVISKTTATTVRSDVQSVMGKTKP